MADRTPTAAGPPDHPAGAAAAAPNRPLRPPAAAAPAAARRAVTPPVLGASAPFALGDLIGKGSFATVFKGRLRASGAAVAIKVVHRAHLRRDKRLLDNFEAEMDILKTLKHPHVVLLLDVYQTADDFHLAMEYCSLGDLSYFIRKRHQLVKTLPLVASLFERYPPSPAGGLHETLVRHLLAQLASALKFLRQHNLVHRDIKPQNLLLKPPPATAQEAAELGHAGLWELPVLKVADFGFARFLPASSMAETLCGSPLYMAPEILRYEKYNAKADLWSVGAVAYEMVEGRLPFPAANHIDLIKKIEDGRDAIKFSDKAAATSHDLRRLIRGLLKRSPAERMGFDEFFEHPALHVEAASEAPLDMSNLDARMYISEYVGKAEDAVAPGAQRPASPLAAALPAGAPSTTAVSASPQRPRISPVASPAPVTQLSPQASAREIDAGLRSRSASPRQSPSPTASVISPRRVGSSALLRSSSLGDGSAVVRRPGSVGSAGSPAAGSIAASANASGAASVAGELGSSLDRGYVVVEKRTVEVNALADDVASSPDTVRKTSSSRVRRLSSIGYGTSPTNALAQALIKSSARLFGTRLDESGVSISAATEVAGLGSAARRSGVLRRPSRSDSRSESQLIADLEKLAAMGKVVALFADVKYSQLSVTSEHYNASTEDPMVQDMVGQEALVLYLKALSLFAAAMERASDWWAAHETGIASERVKVLVQLIREKFNESVDRADLARAYILDGSRLGAGAALALGSSVEKLLFERALELSRVAAVQELAADDLVTSETNYGTALWMLRALVEGDRPDESLNDDDRDLVERLLGKITQRLVALRRRLDTLSLPASRALSPITP